MGSRIFLVILAIAVSLAAGEVFIRITGAAPQVGVTSHERYRLSSNLKIAYEPVGGFRIGTDKSNALGYRGPLYDVTKPLHTFRVAVIGDSISEGLLVMDYKQTYPAILEQELQNKNVQTQVMDFGVNGYNTMQEVETLKEKGMQFHPDLILLQYSLNDTFGDDGSLLASLLNKAKGQNYIERVWDNPLLVHSALYRFIKYRVLNYSIAESWRQSHVSLQKVGEDKVHDGFRELKEIASKHCVLVAIFPWFEKGLEPYPYHKHHDIIASFAKENDFLLIDLLGVFQECQKDNRSVNFDHVHPNTFGHNCVGKALAEYILKNDLTSRCESE
jgi:lysophospholipase L1-like esterase